LPQTFGFYLDLFLSILHFYNMKVSLRNSSIPCLLLWLFFVSSLSAEQTKAAGNSKPSIKVDSSSAMNKIDSINSTQPEVKAAIDVEKDGHVSEAKALNDPGYGLANRAVEVVQTGPPWTAAEQDGKKIRTYQTQPISFLIQSTNKK